MLSFLIPINCAIFNTDPEVPDDEIQPVRPSSQMFACWSRPSNQIRLQTGNLKSSGGAGSSRSEVTSTLGFTHVLVFIAHLFLAQVLVQPVDQCHVIGSGSRRAQFGSRVVCCTTKDLKQQRCLEWSGGFSSFCARPSKNSFEISTFFIEQQDHTWLASTPVKVCHHLRRLGQFCPQTRSQ
jgi:hypothetical protein